MSTRTWYMKTRLTRTAWILTSYTTNFKSTLKSNLVFKKQFLHILKTTFISMQLEFFTGEQYPQCLTRELWRGCMNIINFMGSHLCQKHQSPVINSIVSAKILIAFKVIICFQLVSCPVDLISEIHFSRLFKRWFIRKRVLVRLRNCLLFQHLIYI